MKPNYKDMGMACVMGPKLKEEVENQLLFDAQHYCKWLDEIKFDWSDSCIEGNDGEYLDGSFDRYSGIKLFDKNDELIGDGWMDFIFYDDMERPLFYWQYLDLKTDGKIKKVKKQRGIPKHVKDRLKADFK